MELIVCEVALDEEVVKDRCKGSADVDRLDELLLDLRLASL